MVLGQVDIYLGKKTLDPYNIAHVKINSKWIIELNVKLKTIKLLEENRGEILHHLGGGSVFLGRIQKVWIIKENLINHISS